jgi:hypothetical protein
MSNQIICEFIAKFEKDHECILDREITEPTEYDIYYLNNLDRFRGNEIIIKFFIFIKIETNEKIHVCLRLY